MGAVCKISLEHEKYLEKILKFCEPSCSKMKISKKGLWSSDRFTTKKEKSCIFHVFLRLYRPDSVETLLSKEKK